MSTTTTTPALQNVLDQLDGVKGAGGDKYMARCPCHDDKRQSLSVGPGDNGGVVLCCHANCPTPDIMARIGLRMADLMPKSNGSGHAGRRIVATYDYQNADGALIFQAVRYSPKGFCQRQPDGSGGWVWNLRGVKRVLYGLPTLVKADPSATVHVCEGEKDCDSLLALGLVATCNPGGAGKWRDEYGDTLHSRAVVVLPDNDDAGRRHAIEVANSLHPKATSVKVLALPGLPDKGDVSDWLRDGGTVDHLREIVEAAPEWEQSTATTTYPTPDADEAPSVKRLADAIVATDHFAQDAGGRLYIYRDGVYTPRGEHHVKRRVKALLIEWGLASKWSSHRASEVVEFIRVDAPDLWEQPPTDQVNVKNGLLNVETRTLSAHDPKFLSVVQLPVTYDPEATCPAWDKFIGEVFPDDALPVGYEIPALLMTPYISLQRAILLLGSGANGKSRYLAAIVAFLGKPNVSAISLHKLESDRFAPARLIGKLANVCPDLPSEHLASTSTFKALTGGDMMPAERKYADSFEFAPFARLVFSANNPPRSADSSDGFFRRWLVIPFSNVFEGEDEIPANILDAQLADPAELSGVLNRALDALPDLRGRGITLSRSMVEAADEFRQMTDPVGVWLDANTVEVSGGMAAKRDLIAKYNRDADRAGRPTLSGKALGQAIKRHRPDVREGQRVVHDNPKTWVWLGLALRSEGNP